MVGGLRGGSGCRWGAVAWFEGPEATRLVARVREKLLVRPGQDAGEPEEGKGLERTPRDAGRQAWRGRPGMQADGCWRDG